MRLSLFILLLFIFVACKDAEENHESLFSSMPYQHTSIDFINQLDLDVDMDVFRYRNYYNGGGVGIGDINNDGLADLYFTSNMGANQLYLNKGDFKFENITRQAGVGGNYSWSTGVSMADVNGDGKLDIYVCNSGDRTGGRRNNELFINNGDLTFTESAEQYGLNDKGFTTHAVFIDYDNDGDLDCYVLNNSFRPVSSLGLENIRHVRDSTGGDKLYRNDENKFTDVSDEAGIFGSVIGFGLGVTATDVNQDGWVDLYISNDFFERDYLYINQKDGTFKEELTERFGHISQFSMGTDAADMNNDGYPDLFITDMLPEDNYRLKTTTNFETFDLLETKRRNGFYEQYMRNTLQLNDGQGRYDEVGQYAGVSATDWSWGALLADFNNDGRKEIFVTNGIYRDVTDQDFLNFLASDQTRMAAMRSESVDFAKLVEKMPTNPIENFMFKIDSGLRYKNITKEWGLNTPSHSNGAAYGDLDNDGDLDMIVNNLNQPAFIYRNNTDKLAPSNYLKVQLKGRDKNTFGVGARVNIYYDDKMQMLENLPNKGFQSSMNHELIFGLDTISRIDSMVIHWDHRLRQVIKDIAPNQTLIVDIKEASPDEVIPEDKQPAIQFKKVDAARPRFTHRENPFIDFDRERLIYHMLSREGPALATADINNDGLDDFYIGGAAGQAGAIYIQQRDGTFKLKITPAFDKDAAHEDVDAVFFDADGDGDHDLYVVSGGYELNPGNRKLQDRLYLLNSGDYTAAEDNVPFISHLGSCVIPADYDNDGDIDLFIGGRGIPGKYGMAANSHMLENNGKGQFEDVTGRKAPKLGNLGMVTDAVWADYDNDGDLDLFVVGEWMAITIFKNTGANLQRLNNFPGLVNSEGWWNKIYATDYDNDGNIDFIAGNLGLNSMFKASADSPITLYINDFDKNGSLDHVFTYLQNGEEYPFAMRDEILRQLPHLKKTNIYFKDYAAKTVSEVFSPEELKNSIIHHARQFGSSLIKNNGDGTFLMKDLPGEIQYSPIFAIEPIDSSTFLMAGNFFAVKPEEGRYDANHGVMARMDNDGMAIQKNHDLFLRGEVRDMAVVRSKDGGKILIVAKNNEEVEFYKF
jgi:hypothetical protein